MHGRSTCQRQRSPRGSAQASLGRFGVEAALADPKSSCALTPAKRFVDSHAAFSLLRRVLVVSGQTPQRSGGASPRCGNGGALGCARSAEANPHMIFPVRCWLGAAGFTEQRRGHRGGFSEQGGSWGAESVAKRWGRAARPASGIRFALAGRASCGETAC